MYAELVLLVSFLRFATPIEGRFDLVDRLEKAPDLQFAFIVVRHGITTPKNNLYESDKAFLDMWPEGKNTLTELGQQLMYLVGQSLRTRYERLVPDYRKDQVEITASTDLRATLSTHTLAAGLFPAKTPVIPDIPNWQPVPVFTNADYDKAHLFDEIKEESSCPRYKKIRDSMTDKDEMKKLSETKLYSVKKLNKDLKPSNSAVKTIISLDEAFDVWERYFLEELSEKISPEKWLPKTKVKQGMTQLAQFQRWIRMNGKNEGEKSILQYFTGPLFNKMFTEVIQQQTACTYALMAEAAGDPPQSCFRLRVHGSTGPTVDALLWALADQRTYLSSPGDAVILEVDQLARVKVYLYSPLTPGKKLLEQPLKKFCPTKTCTYDQLITGLKKLGLVFPESDWKHKCNNVEGSEKAQWRKDLQP